MRRRGGRGRRRERKKEIGGKIKQNSRKKNRISFSRLSLVREAKEAKKK